ncbi:hypothetical protein BC833DRAFT_610057 [Globomyces pollinis-pini]|nr:hypothetical protein BC833DRAFT_610057 [Globomyces pollinis-pini]
MLTLLPVYANNLGFICGGPYFQIILRLISMGSLDPMETSKWTLRDYMNYWHTFDTFKNRALFRIKCRKMNNEISKKYLDRTVYHIRKQSWSYFYKVLQGLLMDLFFIITIPIYFYYYLPNWNPPLWTLLDFTTLESLNFVLFAIGLLSMIRINHTIYGHSFAIIFDIPFQHAMQSQYYATSIADFWANRWNLAVQPFLRRIGYEPILKWMNDKNSTSKVSYTTTVIATLCTFTFSGLIHEWLLLMLNVQSTGEQMIFFILHGILLILEKFMIQMILKYTGYHLIKDSPKWLCWIYTYTIISWTAPLFFGTYIRAKVFDDFIILALRFNPF